MGGVGMKPSLKLRPTNDLANFLPSTNRTLQSTKSSIYTRRVQRQLSQISESVTYPSSSSLLSLHLPSMGEQLVMRGTLEGHSGWVTSLATSLENPHMLLSGSRDKTLIIWNLARDDAHYGYPKRSLHGHSHIVSDCVYLLLLSSSPRIRVLISRANA